MADAKQCDRCLKLYKNFNVEHEVHQQNAHNVRGVVKLTTIAEHYSTMDLCAGCLQNAAEDLVKQLARKIDNGS